MSFNKYNIGTYNNNIINIKKKRFIEQLEKYHRVKRMLLSSKHSNVLLIHGYVYKLNAYIFIKQL